MGTPRKVNGRKTREAATEGQLQTGKAKKTLKEARSDLYSVIGSSDPVKYIQAISKVLAAMDDAQEMIDIVHTELEAIIDNCALDAVRGSYE